jgi:hypothetical protein
VEDHHKETDNLEIADQEQTILQELAQAEADKVNGLTHGVLAVEAVEQAEQDIKPILTLQALEDTQDTSVVQETHQKGHQAEVQDGLIVMIQEEELRVVQVDQVFTVLQAEAGEQEEELVEQDLAEAVKDTEITLELQELTQCQTLAQAAEAAEETQAVQESVKLPIG